MKLAPLGMKGIARLAMTALGAAAMFDLHAAPPEETAAVRAQFAYPAREYATGPLWVWNDLLTEEQVRGTMRDLAGQKVRQVFVHPRPGLMTPYLSPEWFRLWKVALDEAERLDMNCWIYDENSYPSGFAGGEVPEQMPESRGRGLVLSEVKAAPAWGDAMLAVYRLDGDKAIDVSAAARAGQLPLRGRYLSASIVRSENSGWHGGRSYVDLLYPGVTQKFLEITHGSYAREVGGQFGKRILGAFADEPEIRPTAGMTWTDDLPAQFERRRGYNLLASLPAMAQEVGDWRRVRHDYARTVGELFIERWAQPYGEWCERHGIAFTGHYWEHEWPQTLLVPDNMAMAAWQQLPGIDCLMNQYKEDVHAQFGNVRIVRELASVANQLGRKRTLCEIYGAGGWDLRFEDMKRIGDWLGVLGINLFDEHLSYITLRGARKRDHPQSFSYHEPWWEAYHVNATYLTRLAFSMAQGRQVNRVLVLEPTTTAWMYQGLPDRLKVIGDTFFDLVKSMEAAQLEYDLGSEDIIARHGANAGAEFVVGQQSYHTVVLPAGTENLEGPTAALLEKFLQAGGTVLCAGESPQRIDGLASERGAALAGLRGWVRTDPSALVARLGAEGNRDGFRLDRAAGDRGILFHQRRQLADGELVLLVNTSAEFPSSGTLTTKRAGIEQWDLHSGASETWTFAKGTGEVTTAFTLPPSGSLLLLLSNRDLPSKPAVTEIISTVAASGATEVRPIAPNVLTLDHADITAGGEIKTGLYFYQANQFAFQKNGMERNPWDSAVQYRDELLRKTFPPGSGFTASYHFTVAESVPADLAIVIERPDLYAVTCNGQSVAARPGDWWLDKAFGRIPLAAFARVGENTVTITCTPFSLLHELEPAYLLGSFALKSAPRGFVVARASPLQLGRWNEQGRPFYSAGVAYRQSFNVTAREGRYMVALPRWYGSVAKVMVNGRPAGYVTAPPWECDVTALLAEGANSVEVTVIGTLKNTLGPHHGNYPLGSAWPTMFQTAPKGGMPPGAEYATVGYGLFEPFTLKQVRSQPK